MYAVIETGGKQYKVSEGDVIDIEKLNGEVGDKVMFEILMLSENDKMTCGNVKAKCEAEIMAHGKGDKIIVFKYKAKKNVRKKQGHRQPFTRVKIVSVK